LPSVRFSKVLIANRARLPYGSSPLARNWESRAWPCIRKPTVTVRTYVSRTGHLHRPGQERPHYLNRSIISAAEITNVTPSIRLWIPSEKRGLRRGLRSLRINSSGRGPSDPADGGEGARPRSCGRWVCPYCPVGGVLKSPEEALEVAAGIGYPVILKASAARRTRHARGQPAEICRAVCAAHTRPAPRSVRPISTWRSSSPRRATSIPNPRRRAWQRRDPGERECTIQRRHQKLLEESRRRGQRPPARRNCHCLEKSHRAAGYTNAARWSPDGRDGRAPLHRSQRAVQGHPVTEFVTASTSSRVRSGSRRRAAGGDPARPVQVRGHAIECRINAENPRLRALARAHHGFHAPAASACAWTHSPTRIA